MQSVPMSFNVVLGAALASACVLCCTAMPFNETLAIEFAKLAAASHCPQDSLESWSCGWKCSANVKDVYVCQGDATQAFVGLWDSTCIVGFQGTHGVLSVIHDIMFAQATLNWTSCDGCRVHSGFLTEYMSLKPCIRKALSEKGCGKGTTIRTTGWSLGAATSTLAAGELAQEGWKVEHYDFGKPRVGDPAFAQWFNKLVGDGAWRVTHHKDPVPHLPPDQWAIYNWNFAHTEPEAFYDGSVTSGHVECTAPDDPKCSRQYESLAGDLVYVLDHFHQMDLRMGKSGCGDAMPNSDLTLVV
mmetsp:Transcript_24539/g.70531  ORF Transcript_24539/g.70531 Transcript_24539/m.70531 type:complete len:300 (-) Transcript_24539:311-1210(-)